MMSRASLQRTLLVASAGVGAWELSGTEHRKGAPQKHDAHASSQRLRAPAGLFPQPALCDARKKTKLEPLQFHAVPLPDDAAWKEKEVISRFKRLASTAIEQVGDYRREKNGVKIYTVKDVLLGKESTIPDPNGKTGLPFARIGEAIIKAPAEDVAALWWVFNTRKDWDPANTTASEVVEEYGSNTRLVYVKGAPKKMISPRDFVFVAHKVPPGDLGLRVGTFAFVQVNAAEAVPPNENTVRGGINSALIVEPIDAQTTRVRYIVEIAPKGWLPALVVEAAADDLPGCLAAMRDHLESQATEDDERRLFERRESLKEKDARHPNLLDSVTASVEDLEALVKMLKGKLEQVKRDERQLGVSLTDLRAKVSADLKKAEARLREARRR